LTNNVQTFIQNMEGKYPSTHVSTHGLNLTEQNSKHVLRRFRRDGVLSFWLDPDAAVATYGWPAAWFDVRVSSVSAILVGAVIKTPDGDPLIDAVISLGENMAVLNSSFGQIDFCVPEESQDVFYAYTKSSPSLGRRMAAATMATETTASSIVTVTATSSISPDATTYTFDVSGQEPNEGTTPPAAPFTYTATLVTSAGASAPLSEFNFFVGGDSADAAADRQAATAMPMRSPFNSLTLTVDTAQVDFFRCGSGALAIRLARQEQHRPTRSLL
jgi:hypothetical protein